MKRDMIMLVTAVGVLVFGCCILIASMIMPPPGEIHHTVLVAFGEILTFAGALFGVTIGRNMNNNNQQTANEKDQ